MILDTLGITQSHEESHHRVHFGMYQFLVDINQITALCLGKKSGMSKPRREIYSTSLKKLIKEKHFWTSISLVFKIDLRGQKYELAGVV